MNKIQSLQRRLFVFGGVIAVLVLVLFLSPSGTSAVKRTDLPLVFPEFEKASDHAESIEIRQAPLPKAGEALAPEDASKEKKITLVRKDADWVLSSAFGHPARPGKVTSLFGAIGGARRQGIRTQQAETFREYANPDGWVQVTVKDKAGKPLADFGIGKTRYPHVYLLVKEGETERVVEAVDFSGDTASVRAREWIETNLWTSLKEKDLVRIDIEQRRDKRTISLVRDTSKPPAPKEGETAPEAKETWKLVAPTEGEADRLEAEDLLRSFTGVNVEEVVAGGAPETVDKEYGLDDPELVVTATGKKPDGTGEVPTWTFSVGKKGPEEAWYVRRGKDVWVFTVKDYALARFRKDPSSFLAKKPETPKEEPPKEGQAPPPAPPEGEKKEGGAPPAPAPGGAQDPGSPDGPPPPGGEKKDGEKKDGDPAPPAPPKDEGNSPPK